MIAQRRSASEKISADLKAMIRRWVADQLIKNELEPGWRVANSVQDIPLCYGHYAVYDGISCKGGGVSADLRDEYSNHYGMKNFDMPIFLYLMDDEKRSAEKWLTETSPRGGK